MCVITEIINSVTKERIHSQADILWGGRTKYRTLDHERIPGPREY